MANGSTAYAELGGGVDVWGPRPSRPRIAAVPAPAPHVHRFAECSGWCPCGLRDDGTLAEYSPAWRAARAGGVR